MKGMRDSKPLRLCSTNGCSLMPFSLIPSIPRTRAVPQAQEVRYELQGCNQCPNSTRFHQSSIKPPKMSLNTPKPPTVKSLILLGLRVGGFGSFGLKAIRNRQVRGFNSHSRLQIFLTSFQSVHFPICCTLRKLGNTRLGNTKPATFSTARLCELNLWTWQRVQHKTGYS